MIKEIKYQGESYSRQTNPPSDKDVLIRWKWGCLKKYEKVGDNNWIEWRLSGRWKNELKWLPCEEPEIEKHYKELHESI
mgnify:CR=1 FL=1